MRIVQTFWTAGRNPLEHNFGWLRPEYNLMSWVLSCLCLRKHYDEVALYTDEQGKHVLIDLLHLPYTEVNVVYDETLCPPQHWAYPKIMTYSLQTKPFLHVDGDVFLPAPIPDEVINAPLIAQNREIGTAYYQKMMQRVFHNPDITLPDFVRRGLGDGSLASYNMGVFGGNDIEFIQQYCQEVFCFMEENHINEVQHRNSNIECNVFFEQILLAAMADKERKEVGSVVSHPMYDQGYTTSEFCNLRAFDNRPIHHLLGGHKYNPWVLRMLVQALLRLYPEMFQHILSLCPKFRYEVFTLIGHDSDCSEAEIRPYLDFIESTRKDWSKLPLENLIKIESMSPTEEYIKAVVKKGDSTVTLSLSPYMVIYTLEGDRSKEADTYLRKRLNCGSHFPLSKIALLPTLSGYGYIEVPLLPIDLAIIRLLSGAELTFEELLDKTLSTYFDGRRNDFRLNYIANSIERLIINSIINPFKV